MKTDGPGHRNLVELSGQTINTSQQLLIPLSPIASSADKVAATTFSRTSLAGVR